MKTTLGEKIRATGSLALALPVAVAIERPKLIADTLQALSSITLCAFLFWLGHQVGTEQAELQARLRQALVSKPGEPVILQTAASNIIESEIKSSQVSSDEQSSKCVFLRYIVQPGDTLLEIAKRFKIDQLSIASANNLANPNNIVAGQVLVMPETDDNNKLAARDFCDITN